MASNDVTLVLNLIKIGHLVQILIWRPAHRQAAWRSHLFLFILRKYSFAYYSDWTSFNNWTALQQQLPGYLHGTHNLPWLWVHSNVMGLIQFCVNKCVFIFSSQFSHHDNILSCIYPVHAHAHPVHSHPTWINQIRDLKISIYINF